MERESIGSSSVQSDNYGRKMSDKEVLTCFLCRKLFQEPMILSCGHTFCLKCVEKWLRKCTNCPLCRMPTLQPIHNITLSEMLAEFKATEKENLSLFQRSVAQPLMRSLRSQRRGIFSKEAKSLQRETIRASQRRPKDFCVVSDKNTSTETTRQHANYGNENITNNGHSDTVKSPTVGTKTVLETSFYDSEDVESPNNSATNNMATNSINHADYVGEDSHVIQSDEIESSDEQSDKKLMYFGDFSIRKSSEFLNESAKISSGVSTKKMPNVGGALPKVGGVSTPQKNFKKTPQKIVDVTSKNDDLPEIRMPEILRFNDSASVDRVSQCSRENPANKFNHLLGMRRSFCRMRQKMSYKVSMATHVATPPPTKILSNKFSKFEKTPPYDAKKGESKEMGRAEEKKLIAKKTKNNEKTTIEEKPRLEEAANENKPSTVKLRASKIVNQTNEKNRLQTKDAQEFCAEIHYLTLARSSNENKENNLHQESRAYERKNRQKKVSLIIDDEANHDDKRITSEKPFNSEHSDESRRSSSGYTSHPTRTPTPYSPRLADDKNEDNVISAGEKSTREVVENNADIDSNDCESDAEYFANDSKSKRAIEADMMIENYNETNRNDIKHARTTQRDKSPKFNDASILVVSAVNAAQLLSHLISQAFAINFGNVEFADVPEKSDWYRIKRSASQLCFAMGNADVIVFVFSAEDADSALNLLDFVEWHSEILKKKLYAFVNVHDYGDHSDALTDCIRQLRNFSAVYNVEAEELSNKLHTIVEAIFAKNAQRNEMLNKARRIAGKTNTVNDETPTQANDSNCASLEEERSPLSSKTIVTDINKSTVKSTRKSLKRKSNSQCSLM